MNNFLEINIIIQQTAYLFQQFPFHSILRWHVEGCTFPLDLAFALANGWYLDVRGVSFVLCWGFICCLGDLVFISSSCSSCSSLSLSDSGKKYSTSLGRDAAHSLVVCKNVFRIHWSLSPEGISLVPLPDFGFVTLVYSVRMDFRKFVSCWTANSK